jgi:hypothetical protein
MDFTGHVHTDFCCCFPMARHGSQSTASARYRGIRGPLRLRLPRACMHGVCRPSRCPMSLLALPQSPALNATTACRCAV